MKTKASHLIAEGQKSFVTLLWSIPTRKRRSATDLPSCNENANAIMDEVALAAMMFLDLEASTVRPDPKALSKVSRMASQIGPWASVAAPALEEGLAEWWKTQGLVTEDQRMKDYVH